MARFVFLTNSKDHWVTRLNEYGVPCAPIYNVQEVFEDPQVKAQNISVTMDHPKLGSVTLLNQGVKLSRTPSAVTRVAPELGQHTQEVLTSLGYSSNEIQSFKDQKAI